MTSYPKNQNDPGKLEVTHRLIMPIDGFLGAIRMQEAVVKKMVADGMLKHQEPVEGTTKAVSIN
ncbi:hypothetical protein CCP3SC15_4100002 [Gammaproteobacteria bacterium]